MGSVEYRIFSLGDNVKIAHGCTLVSNSEWGESHAPMGYSISFCWLLHCAPRTCLLVNSPTSLLARSKRHIELRT